MAIAEPVQFMKHMITSASMAEGLDYLSELAADNPLTNCMCCSDPNLDRKPA